MRKSPAISIKPALVKSPKVVSDNPPEFGVQLVLLVICCAEIASVSPAASWPALADEVSKVALRRVSDRSRWAVTLPPARACRVAPVWIVLAVLDQRALAKTTKRGPVHARKLVRLTLDSVLAGVAVQVTERERQVARR
jgi:hypothetical protein